MTNDFDYDIVYLENETEETNMETKWNDDWRSELERIDDGCHTRLCECRNTRKDLIKMAKLVKVFNPEKSSEDCLVRMMDWIGDWNGQFEVTDLTMEEYDKAINDIEKFAKKYIKIEVA